MFRSLFFWALGFLIVGSNQRRNQTPQVIEFHAPPEKADWFKRCIDIVTLFIVAGGLYLAYDQSSKLRVSIDLNSKSINISTFASIVTQTTEINKVLIDNSKLNKYFFENVDIDAVEDDYEKTQAIARLLLDYFTSTTSFNESIEGNVSGDIMDRTSWNNFVNSTFKTSPIMCRTYSKEANNYGTFIIALVPFECRPKLESIQVR